MNIKIKVIWQNYDSYFGSFFQIFKEIKRRKNASSYPLRKILTGIKSSANKFKLY